MHGMLEEGDSSSTFSHVKYADSTSFFAEPCEKERLLCKILAVVVAGHY